MNELIDSFVEVKVKSSDEFLKLRETLTRIGIANRRDKVLYQSCHILHKRGKYYIVHFKELFALDGRPSTMSEEDVSRRNGIAKAMVEWGLCEAANDHVAFSDQTPVLGNVAVISHKDKVDWELKPKYFIGNA